MQEKLLGIARRRVVMRSTRQEVVSYLSYFGLSGEKAHVWLPRLVVFGFGGDSHDTWNFLLQLETVYLKLDI